MTAAVVQELASSEFDYRPKQVNVCLGVLDVFVNVVWHPRDTEEIFSYTSIWVRNVFKKKKNLIIKYIFRRWLYGEHLNKLPLDGWINGWSPKFQSIQDLGARTAATSTLVF